MSAAATPHPPPAPQQSAPQQSGPQERGLLRALLFGNLLIGTGIMLVPGLLNVLAADLRVSIPTAGTLLAAGAAVVALGAPLAAGLTSRWDRRRLLTGSLLLYALGHALCAIAPSYAALLPLRMATVLAAAVFTPQAAAVVGQLLPPERRAAGITFIFLGWSVATVAGLPLGAYLGAQFGWRAVFFGFALACLPAAWAVARAIPPGLAGAPLAAEQWKAVLRHPALATILLVTAVSSTGQFSLWAYIAPYTQQAFAPTPAQFSLALLALGASGVVGNVLATRAIGRIGTDRVVQVALACMACGLGLAVPLSSSLAGFVVCGLVWGLGTFSSNSAQQARLAQAAPLLAGASIALNTSMMYLGQALGSSLGGGVIASAGYGPLPVVACGALLLALAVSRRASRLARRAAA